MFDTDRWQEIYHVLAKNKLRTALTAFGVFWGMFMLVVLMGSGNGLRNGVMGGFGSFATNSFYMWGQTTSMPYKGFRKGRYIAFNNQDTEVLKRELHGAEVVAPKCQLGGHRGTNYVTRKSFSGSSFGVSGDIPEIIKISPKKIVQGRWLNDKDIQDKRKVAVIGSRVRDVLFEKDEDPIGDYITISGVYFMVIGVHDVEFTSDFSERELETILTPITTFQQAFNYGDRVGWYSIMGKSDVPIEDLEKKAQNILKKTHNVHPDDPRGIGGFNAGEEFGKISGLFIAIQVLVWIVGLGTLLAGIIGVSNIMLVVVKERTKEIGIRKAIGATPFLIISQIILEAVILTGIAGYLGLAAGVWTLEGVNKIIGKSATMFSNPEIDLATAILCLIIIIISGGLAGVIPAQKAARVDPIVALRSE
ncbi:MAG: ABC transporter permease [Salibacteraceae bacterium]